MSETLVEKRRTDIDILRAIAVLSVLLYHFRVPGVSGGFVGVDIFFVISGFLISQQIVSQITAERFSYLSFFARRARRLVPALLVTILGTWVVSIFLLTPNTYRNVLQELIYSIVYLSNFLFWSESGYFDSEAITKPLLHTWSLAVEEQFYLLWPLLLIWAATAGRLRFGLIAAGIASLIACEVVMRMDNAAAFYLFPFRIFEFAIGAYVAQCSIRTSDRAANWIGILAIVTIFATLFLLREESSFPGVNVVPICIATGAIILLRPQWLNSRNVIASILTWIGRISYSAYLIHWPLVVFYVAATDRPLTLEIAAALLAVTLIGAHLMWHLVELPCQRRPQRVFLYAVPASTLIVLAILPVAMPLYESFRQEQKSVDQLLLELEPRHRFITRFLAEPPEEREDLAVLAIVGDSHAVDLTIALRIAVADAYTIHLIRELCDPLVIDLDYMELKELYEGVSNPNMSPENCSDVHAQTLLERIRHAEPDAIIISERWRDRTIPHLEQSIENLKRNFSAPIILMGPNQEFNGPPEKVLQNVTDIDTINSVAWNARRDRDAIERSIVAVATRTGVSYLDKRIAICPEPGHCDYLHNNTLTYVDPSHWTVEGMQVFGLRIFDTLRELITERNILESRTGLAGDPGE